MKPQLAFLLNRVGLGALAWMFVTWSSVGDLRGVQWSTSILLLAALVIVPLVIALARDEASTTSSEKLLGVAEWLQLPAAVMLMLSSAQPAGAKAAMFAAPWVALSVLLAVAGGLRILTRGLVSRWELGRDAGLMFIAIGGAWTLADRLGLHPLGFGSDIVQLTAVHFHFAGLVLPVVAGCVWRETNCPRVAAFAGWGVLIGVPLVAVGITSTQLGGGHVMELISALVLGLSGMIVAILQMKLAREKRWPKSARALWFVSGFSLFFGMTLAILYGARGYWAPLPWLNIPWMRALHGTANALGFAVCGMIGWTLAQRNQVGENPPASPPRAQSQQRRQKPKRW